MNVTDKFEVDGAATIFATRRVDVGDPFTLANVGITEGMHARASSMDCNANMTDWRVAMLLAALPQGQLLQKIKGLCEWDEGD